MMLVPLNARSSSMMEWTHEIALKFLELYEAEELVWNPSHPDRECRHKVFTAWQRIAADLGAGYTVDFLKEKKKYLMASYRGRTVRKSEIPKEVEVAQMKCTSLSGSLLTLWIGFCATEMNHGSRLIHRCMKMKKVTSTNQKLKLRYAPQMNKMEEVDMIMNRSCQCPQMKGIYSTAYNDPTTNDGVVMPSSSGSTLLHTVLLGKRKSLAESDDLRKKFDTASSILERNASIRSAPKERTMCDIYSALLVEKLKAMNPHDRELCMHKIDTIVFEMKYKNAPSPLSVLPYQGELHSRYSPLSVGTPYFSYSFPFVTPAQSPLSHFTTQPDVSQPNYSLTRNLSRADRSVSAPTPTESTSLSSYFKHFTYQ